jgi:nicotinamide-nucleotide amidase
VFAPDVLESAARTIALLRAKHHKLALAESCTGGLVASAITAIAGSSDVFESGFVTYSNSAKMKMIGVESTLLERHGAVSGEVAEAMAAGALEAAGADIAVSVTGIAGPGGGSPGKPVGLVFIACAQRDATTRVQRHAFGDIGREAVRLASVRAALKLLEESL